MKLKSLFLAGAIVGNVFFAHAQRPVKAPKATTLRFLTQDSINPALLLPPPAKDGSEAQTQEMNNVKQLIKSRSKERYERAKWDAMHEDPSPFISEIGPTVDLDKLPATKKLLADVLNDQTIATSAAKDYFKRKFPVAAAMPGAGYPEWTCDTGDRKPESRPLRSYPSGHATMGYTFGAVLAALVPEKAQAILARSADYAYSREVCGDHYHSDVEAGHVLGTALGVLFLNNDKLKPELDAAKTELREQLTK